MYSHCRGGGGKFLLIFYIDSMNDSGYFVLARWIDEEDKTDLEITAFKVI